MRQVIPTTSLLLFAPFVLAFQCEAVEGGLWTEPTLTPRVHCIVMETRQRRCVDCCGDYDVTIPVCEVGDGCVAPAPYNISRDDLRCVDSYRYQTRTHAATCEEIEDHLFGRLACLQSSHCTGDPTDIGDWICTASRACVCPAGGHCPPPLPPGAGSSAGTPFVADAGPVDAGIADAGIADVGVADAADVGAPDAGVPDTGRSGGSGAGGG